MSEVSERHRKLAAGFTARAEAVPPDRWSSQSPCPDWTARDIVTHVTGNCGMFLGLIGKEAPPGPSSDEDLVQAWVAGRDAIQAALDDPDVATMEYEGAFGRSTFEQAIDNFQCIDLIVHGWDLARATGGNERFDLDPDETRALLEKLRPADEMLRSPGAMGPKLEPPPDADEQTQLLAFMGRRAW